MRGKSKPERKFTCMGDGGHVGEGNVTREPRFLAFPGSSQVVSCSYIVLPR